MSIPLSLSLQFRREYEMRGQQKKSFYELEKRSRLNTRSSFSSIMDDAVDRSSQYGNRTLFRHWKKKKTSGEEDKKIWLNRVLSIKALKNILFNLDLKRRRRRNWLKKILISIISLSVNSRADLILFKVDNFFAVKKKDFYLFRSKIYTNSFRFSQTFFLT